MFRKSYRLTFLFITALAFLVLPYSSQAQETCSIENRACILKQIEQSAAAIGNASWRDQVYRELAKTLAFDGHIDLALAVVDKIESPDTKAMSIRGIGMAAADKPLTQEQYSKIFTKLRMNAEKIPHPPSYAIALTYIAMSQAFAGDNDGAWATAADMENGALRYKAYAETAEIQAEKGDYEAAMKSIGFIDSSAFRNKAYSITSKIFADREDLDKSYNAALKITNDYKRAVALQYVLDAQKPREIPHQ